MNQRVLNLLLLSLVAIGCEQQKTYSTDEIIESLELKLNSINNNYPNDGVPIADSLLEIDSSNHIAIVTKAYSAFNNHDTKESLRYFKKICAWDNFEPVTLLLLGWSYERENMMDSAKHYYELAYEEIDSSWQAPIGSPQLLTVTRGKNEGLLALERNSHLPEIYYLQLENDITNYENEGLSEFFPLFFEDNISEEFYVKIPDSLFDNGIINSMEKVELVFARMGINVDVRSTDSANKGYKLVTTEKYLPKLLKIDTLGIKRL
ncbi:MAG: hypothetical protein ABJN36_08465 [Cyclobacteriaceae bacterium]